MTEKPWFKKRRDELESELNVISEKGLSEEEVVKRRERDGKNILTAAKSKGLLSMFFEQFKDVMVIILLIAAVISGILGEKWDATIIVIVVVLNAILGVVQESKAEKSLEALKKLATPMAKVIREDRVLEVKSEELVQGDIVILEAGDFVPADGVILECSNLMIEESALTGESVPVEKEINIPVGEDLPLGDRKNYVFTSSLVTNGRGRFIVTDIGMNSEIGRIAGLLQNQEEIKTPLQEKLDELGKILALGALAVCTVIFVLGYLQGRPLLQMFMTSVSLAVAAIPEGLPAIVTIVLSLGVQRMIGKNAIVRRLPAVETLGTASVICSDKTGTLTQNKMKVTKIYTNDKIKDIKDVEIENTTDEIALNIGLLCNDATIEIGNPTEVALIHSAKMHKLDKKSKEKELERVAEIPFDSERKLMTTVHKFNGKYRVFTKGALDFLLDRCSKILVNGKIQELTESKKEEIKDANNEMSSQALRVIALSYKDESRLPSDIKSERLEKDLIFVGMQGMIDPPRPEAKEAVAKCRVSGIKPVMITGDHKATAIAIAKELGILKNDSEAIEGKELEKMSEKELMDNVHKYSVYARVSPEHKVRIVKAWQDRDNIVAMTGDGVNDAPALKRANIGCAMGIAGTEVSKQASDMILTDDNFATIVSAVEEGRHLYDNIKKSIHFLLACNIGEIITLLIAVLLKAPLPLLPIHILWVNLVTDSFPALALGLDPVDKDIMKRKPRDPKKSMFANGLGFTLIAQGIMIGLITKIAFQVGLMQNLEVGRTMALATLCFAQLAHSFNVRTVSESIFKVGFTSNMHLIKANLLSGGLVVVITAVPKFREIFKISQIGIKNWMIVILLSLIPIVVVEISKLFKDSDSKDIDYKYSYKIKSEEEVKEIH